MRFDLFAVHGAGDATIGSRSVAQTHGEILVNSCINCDVNTGLGPGNLWPLRRYIGDIGLNDIVIRQLIVQDYIQQRLIHPNAPIVFNETRFAKPIHNET